jgi:hypothetical protein
MIWSQWKISCRISANDLAAKMCELFIRYEGE